MNRLKFNDNDFATIADYDLIHNVVTASKAKNIKVRVGNIFSTDLFYTPKMQVFDTMEKYGVKALTICTVSDHIRSGEVTTSAERQTTFNEMVEIVLESVLLLD